VLRDGQQPGFLALQSLERANSLSSPGIIELSGVQTAV
jgi:hypothetical protein